MISPKISQNSFLWLATLFFALAVCPFTLAQGPVGYWTFDEGTGTTAADSSGNGHTATLVNGPLWVTGKIGKAVSADGINDYVSIPAIDLSATSAVTVALWVNHTYSTSGGHTLFENSSNFNGSSTGFGFFPDDADCLGMQVGLRGNVGYNINCYSQPTSGVWHHLAVVFDKSKAGNGEVTLYIDGILQTPTRNYFTNDNTNTFGNNPTYLFSRGGTQEYAAGTVDDLRIYNRALSVTEIQQLYNPATLVSIALTPASPSIAKGATLQFTATGNYDDGSQQNITSSVTWTSSSTTVATIASSGLATTVGTGNTTIQATSGSVSGSTLLTITPPTLVSIAITPANTSIVRGNTQQYTATGIYSDGSQQNLTTSVNWSSSNTAAATISSSGLATGVATGSTTIQATFGSTTASTQLTVTATLVSIAVTPANPSISTGTTQQFTATGTYSDATQQNITNQVTWSSGSTSVATINSAGLATAVAQGSSTIQATSGTITGSATLTVTQPTGLAGYWTFDEGTGTTAADSSGNGHTATLVNGPLWVTGKIGKAVSADGINDYVSIPAIDLSATSAVTVALWVNHTYSTSGGHTLFENSSNFNGSSTGFGFFPDDADCLGMQVGLRGNVGYNINCYSQPTSGVWHHLAVVFDKSKAGNGEVTLYIDGILQTPTRNYFTNDNTNTFGNNPTYLFSRGGTQEYAAGTVDDLRIYNRALSVTEIQQLYNPATLVSIALTPASPSIAKGATLQFTATGNYDDGSQQNITSSVTWTSSSTTVATIASSGLATTVGTGNTTIQATSGSVSGSTLLTITPPTLVSIAITPANTSIVRGNTQQYTATGIYSDGSQQNLTTSVNWSSSNTAAATISSSGLATGVATGSTTIQATFGSTTASTQLTVTATLVSIAVTPANPSISTGTTQQFTATGTYSDATQQNITNQVTWSSGSTSVATINSAGLATAVAQGSSTIQATSGTITGSATLTVTQPTGLAGYWTFDEGTGTTAADSSGNGHTATLVNGPLWVTGKIGKAVSADGINDYVSIPAIDLSATSAVTVALWVNHTYSTSGGHTLFENSSNFNGSSTGFGFFPDDADCLGMQVGLRGNVGYNINCYSQPTSGVWHHLAVVFDKSKAGNGEVTLYIDGILQTPTRNYFTNDNTNTFGNNPTYLFSRGGTQEYAAGTVDDLRIYNRALSVTEIQQLYNPATLVSIALTPTNVSLPKGFTQQYKATGTYSDGSTKDITSTVAWSSSVTTVASITGSGVVTGVGTGTSTILATSGSIQGSTQLTITQPVIVAIAVNPANASIVKNTTQQYAAIATYSDNTQQDVTTMVTWSSTNTAVATISATGLATGIANGTTSIQATSGTISETGQLSVTANLLSITVTPTNASLSAGLSQQYTATGFFSDSSQQNLTTLVTWSSTNPTAATINAAGLATTIATGSTTIQATMNSVTGSTGLTVTTPVLTSINITPASSAIASGATLQYTATGVYSNGSSQNLTGSVTWSSTNPAAATINSAGLATAIATGSTTIQATSGSVSGSTPLTVAYPFPGIPYDLWVDFEHDTLGSLINSSELIQSSRGATGTWDISQVNGLITAQTVAQGPATVTGDVGNRGMSVDVSTTTPAYLEYILPSPQPSLSLGVWYKTGNPGDRETNLVRFITLRNFSYGTMQRLSDERSSFTNMRQVRVGPTDTAIPVDTDTWYWFSLKWVQGGMGVFNVYDTSMNLIGSNEFTDDTNVPIHTIQVGDSAGAAQSGEHVYLDDFIVDYTTAAFPLLPRKPIPLTVSVQPTEVVAGATAVGTLMMATPAPTGGATVSLQSSSAAAIVPAHVTIPAGLQSQTFTITTTSVTFGTAASISASYNGSSDTAILSVDPVSISQVASDTFNRSNASTLGGNWTPLIGTNAVALQVAGNQVMSTATSPSIGKELYYGGYTWSADQYSEAQITTASGSGFAGPAVRMTSNDTYYACVVTSTGTGNASVAMMVVNSGTATTMTNSTTATVRPGDTVRCSVQRQLLTMTNQTTSTTLLTYVDGTVTSGYPGLVDSAGSSPVNNYVLENWAGGAVLAPSVLQTLASDNFNRADALTLGSNWAVGFGHGPIQIVGQAIEPYPSGGVQPSKEHYVAYGTFPNDQWSQFQVEVQDTVGDMGAELRASATADNMYVADVNITGGPGVAMVRLVKVIEGTITPLIIDQQWSSVSPGDTIRGQVQGNLISLVNVTTGSLLLTISDTDNTSGYPGVSLQAGSGTPADHIADNWSAGTFK